MIKEFFQTNKKVILIVGLVAALVAATMCFVFAATPKSAPIDTGAISSTDDSSTESSSEIISSAPVVVVPDITPTVTVSSTPPTSSKAASSTPTPKKDKKPLAVEGKVESKPVVSSKPVVPKVSSVPTPPASSAPVSSAPPSSQPVAPPPPVSSEIDVDPPPVPTPPSGSGEKEHGDIIVHPVDGRQSKWCAYCEGNPSVDDFEKHMNVRHIESKPLANGTWCSTCTTWCATRYYVNGKCPNCVRVGK